MRLSRRTLMGSGLASLAGLATANPFNGAGRSAKRPKNVIFCVSDGMSHQTMAMADVLRRVQFGRSSYWASLMREDYAFTGLQMTRSLNSIVTDSSAASSSWGCGRHIWNGQVNEFPDGTKLETLTRLVSAKGARCGLVTTTTITHATPCGFAINSPSRDNEAFIAEQYLTSGVDVLMGGGNRHFSPTTRADKVDLYSKFQDSGFKVIRHRDDLKAGRSGKVLGIFSDSHLPFSVDRDNDPKLQAEVPTLAELATTALANLKGSPNGFLLQIEGGKVDHGAHANDLAAMVHDQIAFEEAVRVAVEFALQDGETLVVITADHATGGASVNGAGDEYIDSTAGLETISGMKSSFSPLIADLRANRTVAGIQDVHASKLGLKLTAKEAETILAALSGPQPFAGSQFHGSLNATLAMIHGNHSKITWTSGNHTHEHVLLTAVGPGAEKLATVTENISLFDTLTGVWGVKHSNPTMTFEEAKTHMAKKPVALFDRAEDEPLHL